MITETRPYTPTEEQSSTKPVASANQDDSSAIDEAIKVFNKARDRGIGRTISRLIATSRLHSEPEVVKAQQDETFSILVITASNPREFAAADRVIRKITEETHAGRNFSPYIRPFVSKINSKGGVL